MPKKGASRKPSLRTANKNWRCVSVYLPPELFRQIEKEATLGRRSLSAQIVVMLEQSEI